MASSSVNFCRRHRAWIVEVDAAHQTPLQRWWQVVARGGWLLESEEHRAWIVEADAVNRLVAFSLQPEHTLCWGDNTCTST